LPFPPKLVPPSDREQKLEEYRTAEWMRRIAYPLVTELDMGMPVDLIDMSAFSVSAPAKNSTEAADISKRKDEEEEEVVAVLDDADLALLYHPDNEEDKQTALIGRHRPLVPWLRRTEYMSSEGSKMIGRKKENIEAKRLQQEIERAPENFDRSREAQLAAVERTFTHMASIKMHDLRHPTNKNLRAVECIPIFPNLDTWPNMYAQCVFDDDPYKLTRAASVRVFHALHFNQTDGRRRRRCSNIVK
jgi:RNA polymerase II-associated factor 1